MHEAGAGLAIGNAIDPSGPPMALKGLEDDGRLVVKLATGRAVIAKARQARLKGKDPCPLIADGQGCARRGRRLNPQPMPRRCEPCPREQLAGIFLAVRRDIGMADYAAVSNLPARSDLIEQRNQCRDLGVWKGAVAELVPGIDQLNTDGDGIDIALAFPE